MAANVYVGAAHGREQEIAVKVISWCQSNWLDWLELKNLTLWNQKSASTAPFCSRPWAAPTLDNNHMTANH